MASVAYISAAANRYPQAADISTESLVAFGSSKLVALWDISDPSDRGVFQTLPGHEGLVTCVRFVHDGLLVSGDETGVLRCWSKVGSQWEFTSRLQAHKQAISSLCSCMKYTVTGSSDACVKIWTFAGKNESDGLRETQTVQLQGCYPQSLAIADLPHSQAIVLAIGGTDTKIRVWTCSEDVFVPSVVLSGHEDWVRSLDFAVHAERLVLSSGSQDATIRLWRIEASAEEGYGPEAQPDKSTSDDLLDDFEASLGTLTDGKEDGGRQISLKRHLLSVRVQGRVQQFSITFDALLVGHEAGVTSLRWQPTDASATMPALLSASTDSSLTLWSPSVLSESSEAGSSSIWISQQRFGDIGGQRLGGFVCGLWRMSGREVLAAGWGGGWRRWRCTGESGRADERWYEIPGISGHRGPVKGLDWSPKGEYLISSGLDQTTRIHGMMQPSGSAVPVWHELARPQIHGYDLLGVKFLNALKFASIADEKVARVFEAPLGFVKIAKDLNVAIFGKDELERPVGATVAPLGLSNKAVAKDSQPVDIHAIGNSGPTQTRPLEGDLAAVTLWPEIEKVFGHGYELISLAVSNSQKLIATACKATTAEHAVVRLYETDRWRPFGKPLEGHSLTVTRIAFSPDDRFVLTVSRDRSWRLFEEQDHGGYVPLAMDKSHGRIIWDCAWAHEGDVFATASRDKTVKVWKSNDASGRKWTAMATIVIKETSATAVAFSPSDGHDCRRLAVGLENGGIHIYWNQKSASSDWSLESVLDSSTAHNDHVHQLSWRPSVDSSQLQLASCSEDGTLKVVIVHVATNVKTIQQ